MTTNLRKNVATIQGITLGEREGKGKSADYSPTRRRPRRQAGGAAHAGDKEDLLHIRQLEEIGRRPSLRFGT